MLQSTGAATAIAIAYGWKVSYYDRRRVTLVVILARGFGDDGGNGGNGMNELHDSRSRLQMIMITN